MAQWFWRRRFLNFLNVSLPFRNYLPLEKDVVLNLNKLESLLPKDALCQVWLKLAHGSWEENFKISSMYLLFRNYLPLEEGVALHLNKLESTSPKDALCQVWLKLAQWFWRRFLIFSSMYFGFFIIISPWKRVWPFIWTNLNLPTKGCFVLSLVEIGLVILEKKIFKSHQCIFSIL